VQSDARGEVVTYWVGGGSDESFCCALTQANTCNNRTAIDQWNEFGTKVWMSEKRRLHFKLPSIYVDCRRPISVSMHILSVKSCANLKTHNTHALYIRDIHL